MFLQKYKGDIYMVSDQQSPKGTVTISKADFEKSVPAGEGAAKNALNFLKKVFSEAKEPEVDEPVEKSARIRLTKIASITAELDKVADEIQSVNPQAALALDQLSDILENRVDK